MNALRRLWIWFRGFFTRREKPFQTVVVDDFPERPVPGTVYVIGENGYRWCVGLVCPCGCGSTIQLNLLPDTSPRWRFDVHSDDTLSLSPSVCRTTGCRSHFFLRRGLVEWCRPVAAPRRS